MAANNRNLPLNDGTDDDIIELVDIIEKGTIPAASGQDTGAHASMHDLDKELDDMFGDIQPANTPSTARASDNPTDSAANSDSNDFDSILNEALTDPHTAPTADPASADSASANNDPFDIFTDPLDDTGLATQKNPDSNPPKLEDAYTATEMGMDDLDALLSGSSVPKAAPKAQVSPMPDAPFDIDALLEENAASQPAAKKATADVSQFADLDTLLAETQKTPPVENAPAREKQAVTTTDVDELEALLNGTAVPNKNAEQKTDSVDVEKISEPDIEALLAEFATEKPTVDTAQSSDKAHEKALQSKKLHTEQAVSVPDFNLEDLDALLDDSTTPKATADHTADLEKTDPLDLDALLEQEPLKDTADTAEPAPITMEEPAEFSLQELEHLDELLETPLNAGDPLQDNLPDSAAKLHAAELDEIITQIDDFTQHEAPTAEEVAALEQIPSTRPNIHAEKPAFAELLNAAEQLDAADEPAISVPTENIPALEGLLPENTVLDKDLIFSKDALDEILQETDPAREETVSSAATDDSMETTPLYMTAYSPEQIDTMEREISALQNQLDEFARGMAAVEARISSVEVAALEQDEQHNAAHQLFENILTGQNPLGAQLVGFIRNVLTVDLAPRVESLVRSQIQAYEAECARHPVPAPPDTQAIADQVREKLQPDLERMAAGAAAQIIREEISLLLQDK